MHAHELVITFTNQTYQEALLAEKLLLAMVKNSRTMLNY
jgi:hypothetical protein